MDSVAGAVSAYGPTVLIFLASLPLVALVALARYRWLRRRDARWPLRTALAEVGMIAGTAPWLYLMLRPYPARYAQLRLIPLEDLISLAERGDLVFFLVQLVGNLLVFAALGFFAPIRFTVLASLPRVLALIAAISATIELTQLVLGRGRVTSFDDVMINAVGATIAAMLSRRWWRTDD